MITFADYLFEVERRKNEIAEADQHRLSLRAPRGHSAIAERIYSLLARLGELLIAWGQQLQTRSVTESGASPR